jgi:hypothetical protein
MNAELRETFEWQADWRREKAVEYPDDVRNLEAARVLDRLAATADAVPPDVVAAYEGLFEDAPDSEEWSDMLREVGFHGWYDTAEEFVREFIERRREDRLRSAEFDLAN